MRGGVYKPLVPPVKGGLRIREREGGVPKASSPASPFLVRAWAQDDVSLGHAIHDGIQEGISLLEAALLLKQSARGTRTAMRVCWGALVS